MSIIRCPKGHFYDNEKFDSCPTCMKNSGPSWQMDEAKTVSLDMAGGAREIHLTAAEPEKQSVKGNWDSEKTVSLGGYGVQELLTGWLVCVSGVNKGKDYRLYAGFNRIGRSMESDICVQDPMVSASGHCSVVYDDKGSQFYLVPGKGTITYLNQEMVQGAVKIEEGDSIKIGESLLVFVPFCKGAFTWKTMSMY